MITTNKKHSYELTWKGRRVKCYYRMIGLNISHLSVYLPSGQKVTPGFADEVELKSRILATHHKQKVKEANA